MFYFILFMFAIVYLAWMSCYFKLILEHLWEEYKFRRMIKDIKHRKKRLDEAMKEALDEYRRKEQ